MTDAFGNPEDDSTERMVSMSRKDIKRLQEQAKEGKKAVAENDQLKRKIAFAEAGVPTSSRLGDLFVKGYDGDATPEAIKTAWSELNGEQTSGGQASPTDEELRLLEAGADLTSGRGQLPPDKLAERDRRLREAAMQHPNNEKLFDQIYAEYGGVTGSLMS